MNKTTLNLWPRRTATGTHERSNQNSQFNSRCQGLLSNRGCDMFRLRQRRRYAHTHRRVSIHRLYFAKYLHCRPMSWSTLWDWAASVHERETVNTCEEFVSTCVRGWWHAYHNRYAMFSSWLITRKVIAKQTQLFQRQTQDMTQKPMISNTTPAHK